MTQKKTAILYDLKGYSLHTHTRGTLLKFDKFHIFFFVFGKLIHGLII
jgi:hypothetical protein